MNATHNITVNIASPMLAPTFDDVTGTVIVTTTATVSITYNGKTLATWNERNVKATLAGLATEYTHGLGDSLIVDLYPSAVLVGSTGTDADEDAYLAIVQREPERTLAMHRIPLQSFRHSVGRAAASHAAWLHSHTGGTTN